MLFFPKKFKFKKIQKGKKKKKVNNVFSFKSIYKKKIQLKAITTGILSSKQISTLRQTTNKRLKKKGKIIIKIFPNISITKKPTEVRMGKGKGNVNKWVYKVKTGDTICEIETPFIPIGIKALKLSQYKLPIKTKILSI